MSKNNFISDKIKQLKAELYIKKLPIYHIIPSFSIFVNEHTFAVVFYHFSLECERIIDSINFYSDSNNTYILVGQYYFNNNIIKEPYHLIQMKVENENLIIITKEYLIIDKIEIINGKYSFNNIISQRLYENPFKILDNKKIVFYNENNLKIYQFSMKSNSLNCLFELSYDIFNSINMFENKTNKLKKNYEKENDINKNDDNIEIEDLIYKEIDIEEQNLISFDENISNKLCDIIEIKEKSLIIVSFSKFKRAYYDKLVDFTFSKYIISIIDTKKYQIISHFFNLIEAEKLFYFGKNELFSFGFRKFFKLNLLNLKKELILSENKKDYGSYYYHNNIIPILNKNKLLCFGFYRRGYWFNKNEHMHCCLFDINSNNLKEIDISNLFYKCNDYYPLISNDDKIVLISTNDLALFKLNSEEKKSMINKEKIFLYQKPVKRSYNEVRDNKTEKRP